MLRGSELEILRASEVEILCDSEVELLGASKVELLRVSRMGIIRGSKMELLRGSEVELLRVSQKELLRAYRMGLHRGSEIEVLRGSEMELLRDWNEARKWFRKVACEYCEPWRLPSSETPYTSMLVFHLRSPTAFSPPTKLSACINFGGKQKTNVSSSVVTMPPASFHL